MKIVTLRPGSDTIAMPAGPARRAWVAGPPSPEYPQVLPATVVMMLGKPPRPLSGGSSVAEVARAFEINPNLLHRWRKEFRHGPGNAFSGAGKRRWEETLVAQLERKVGQQTVEIDFLKGCLQRIEEQRMLQALTGNPRSTGRSKKK